MREALFKGIRKDNNKWVEGNYINNERDEECYITLYESCERIVGLEYNVYEIIPETLCQYIWLQDIHKRKVFLDDIILIDGSDKCVVKLYRGRYFAESIQSKIKYSWNELAFNRCREFEIIGNTHDDPELLEEVIK